MKLTKPQKTLSAAIESEGGKIVAYRQRKGGMEVDYTFDNTQVFTQHLPAAASLNRRWLPNFRSAIRKTRRTIEASK